MRIRIEFLKVELGDICMSQHRNADEVQNNDRQIAGKKRGFGGDWLDIFLMLAVITAAIIGIYSFVQQMPKDLQPLMMVAGTAAGVIGWGAGILFSPYGGRDQLSSRGTGRLLTGLIVGFLIAWFWKPIMAFFQSCGPNAVGFFSSGLFPVAAICTIIFLLMMISTYVLRTINQARRYS